MEKVQNEKKSFKEVVRENKAKIIGTSVVIVVAGVGYILYRELPHLQLLKDSEKAKEIMEYILH